MHSGYLSQSSKNIYICNSLGQLLQTHNFFCYRIPKLDEQLMLQCFHLLTTGENLLFKFLELRSDKTL